MLANTIIGVAGDPVCFAIDHRVNGNTYSLATGERYRITIKKRTQDDDAEYHDSGSAQFEFDANLDPDVYYFEIAIVKNGVKRVISPAVDENGARLNALYILRSL